MAFLGLFNYDKAGPGISKNAPQKKTYVVFFETFFRNFWKFIPINFVYSLICAFGVTFGLASAGLTNVTRNIARDKHSFGLSDFFDTIRKNWRQSLCAGIINIIVYAVLIFDLFFCYANYENNLLCAIGLAVCAVMLFVFTFMNYYIWTLIITFSLNLIQIYKNSFRFVFLNFGKNISCFVLTIVLYLVLLVATYFARTNLMALTLVILFMICCVPAFRFLMVQYFTFPTIKKYIIDPYYEAHPGEDIDKRRDLGIEIPEEDEEEEDDEAVFED